MYYCFAAAAGLLLLLLPLLLLLCCCGYYCTAAGLLLLDCCCRTAALRGVLWCFSNIPWVVAGVYPALYEYDITDYGSISTF